jgi:hypothetical protein
VDYPYLDGEKGQGLGFKRFTCLTRAMVMCYLDLTRVGAFARDHRGRSTVPWAQVNPRSRRDDTFYFTVLPTEAVSKCALHSGEQASGLWLEQVVTRLSANSLLIARM